MSSRYDLIARKQQVIAQIERLQRELEKEQASADKASTRHIGELESKLERLRAEEYQLRIAIDRSAL